MWIANFFVSGSMTMVLPFISLYVNSLGDFSTSYVQNWSGWIFGITFVTAFIFSPIWGRFGDKHGRKTILVLFALGMSLTVFLMGYATNVWQLFILRFIMGVFTGFVSMSQALIAVQTPQEIAGRVLGTLQTGSITGALLGPMIGGIFADTFGFAETFKWTAMALLLSAMIVAFGIKEMQVKVSSKEKASYSSKEVLLHIVRHPVLLVVMLMSAVVQIAHFSIQPILPLYVAELNGLQHIALFSGMTFSAAGLGNLFMSRRWGKLGDRIGYMKILIILLFISGLVYLPGAFVTSVWQLILLRFLLGISLGGIVPLRIAYIRQEAPMAMQGEVLGYNTSLRFFGNMAGPALGGMLAGFFGFEAVFFVTSGILILGGIATLTVWYKYEYADNKSHSWSS
ncbi:MAG TPA: MFS transporter [Cerasibacillus sp.]|uniref:MFS transporter n=1 Tax=Cerasibacillus sp. TaxID=2498711 RepID=UPI002F3F8994